MWQIQGLIYKYVWIHSGLCRELIRVAQTQLLCFRMKQYRLFLAAPLFDCGKIDMGTSTPVSKKLLWFAVSEKPAVTINPSRCKIGVTAFIRFRMSLS